MGGANSSTAHGHSRGGVLRPVLRPPPQDSPQYSSGGVEAAARTTASSSDVTASSSAVAAMAGSGVQGMLPIGSAVSPELPGETLRVGGEKSKGGGPGGPGGPGGRPHANPTNRAGGGGLVDPLWRQMGVHRISGVFMMDQLLYVSYFDLGVIRSEEVRKQPKQPSIGGGWGVDGDHIYHMSCSIGSARM